MTQPSLSFIVVTYNSAGTIAACLRAIVDQTSASYEIVIVDNSPDGTTIEEIRGFAASYPEVLLHQLRPDENIGFSRACNLGARHASGKYLFLLNPDTQLMNDAGAILSGCLEQRPQALAAGPAIFDDEGQITRTCRNLPSLFHILLDSTGLDRWWGAYKLTRFAHDRPTMVEQIVGAAILVRRRDYERLGGMDERFFLYFEEVDLCKRFKDAGGEIWFWPDAKVRHIAGQSCEVGRVRARMIYTLRESRRKYFAKHFGQAGQIALEVLNRLEAFQKLPVLLALWLLFGESSYRDKASGFWGVAIGVPPRT
jgi:N-acetylglucosaminyl-diphospho-decaprenol L-rhamnosyltransferase